MLAAILFCSLGSTMLTACGDDDDDKGKEPQKANADVRIAVVTQNDTYNMFTFDFSLTDPSGKTTNYKFDSSDKSDDKFYENEASSFETASIPYLLMSPNVKEYLENVNMHHYVIKNVPSGSKIDYKTVAHLVKTYEPKEKGNSYFMPTVMVTLVIDGKDRPFQSFLFNANFGFDKSIYDKFIERYDNKVIEEASKTLTIVY